MQRLNSNTEIKDLIEEKKLLRGIQKKAALKKIPIIDISVGRFLELICLLNGPKKILEIGCGNGFSSYFLIKNLAEGFYTGIDLNRERIKEAEKFISCKLPGKNFKFMAGNALKLIPDIKEKFDLVFIDGAKYEYPFYIKAVEIKLNPRALVIADNIFYNNKIFKHKISKHDFKSVNGIKEYINYIRDSDSFRNYFFDISDGISISKFL